MSYWTELSRFLGIFLPIFTFLILFSFLCLLCPITHFKLISSSVFFGSFIDFLFYTVLPRSKIIVDGFFLFYKRSTMFLDLSISVTLHSHPKNTLFIPLERLARFSAFETQTYAFSLFPLGISQLILYIQRGIPEGFQ